MRTPKLFGKRPFPISLSNRTHAQTQMFSETEKKC